MTRADRQLASVLGRRAPLHSDNLRPADPSVLETLRTRAYAAGFALVDMAQLDREDPPLGMRLRAYVTSKFKRA